MNITRNTFALTVGGMLIFIGCTSVSTARTTIPGDEAIRAAYKGNVRIVRAYLNTHPDRKSKTFNYAFRESFYNVNSTDHNHRRIVAMFIDHGADATDALSVAISVNNPDLAKVAIAKGAVINKRYADSMDTPLSHATHARDFEIVKMLKAAGAKK